MDNFQVFKGEQVFQLVLVKISPVLPAAEEPKTGERDVLSAHATWEFSMSTTKSCKKIQAAKPEFEEIAETHVVPLGV